MGKLHTLRRAIERDPKRWYYRSSDGSIVARAASRGRGGWVPKSLYYWGPQSYRAFVAHVLEGITGVGTSDGGSR